MRPIEKQLRISRVLHTLDYVTTYTAFHVKSSRPARELNPIAAFFIKRNRWDILALFKIAAVIITHRKWQNRDISTDPQIREKALKEAKLLNTLVALVVVNNSWQIYRRIKFSKKQTA